MIQTGSRLEAAGIIGPTRRTDAGPVIRSAGRNAKAAMPAAPSVAMIAHAFHTQGVRGPRGTYGRWGVMRASIRSQMSGGGGSGYASAERGASRVSHASTAV